MPASRVVPLTSPPITWAPSATLPVDLNFLNPARSMSAPVIQQVRIRFKGVLATGTSGGPARTFPQIFSQIQLSDIAGDRCNVRGSTLRVIDLIEYGDGYTDAFPTPTFGVSLAGQAFEFWLRIPFRPMKCSRRNDYGLNLREFVDGGKMQLQTNPAVLATNFVTVTSGTITVFADVVDEGIPEAKSRIIWQDQQISKTEDNYNVSGLARYLVAYNGEGGENTTTKAPTGWGAQNITSKTLELSQIPDMWFKDYYKQESHPSRADPGIPATASAYVTEDPVLLDQAIPFLNLDSDESISSLPQMATVHYKTDLGSLVTANLPQMIVCAITERSDAATARTLGGNWRSNLAKKAYVIMADGSKRPITEFSGAIQKFLPFVLV